MSMNAAIRIKSNEEMLSEILPDITADVRKGGLPAAAESIALAKHFGASLSQIINACRAGKGLEPV
jgi:hypothetical protein